VNLVTRLLLGVALAKLEPSLHGVERTLELGFGNLRTRIMWQCIGLKDTNTRRGGEESGGRGIIIVYNIRTGPSFLSAVPIKC
jgi:hypothetical protein